MLPKNLGTLHLCKRSDNNIKMVYLGLKSGTFDLDVLRSISVEEKDKANLKNLAIFYLITLSWILVHENSGILSIGMKPRLISLEGKMAQVTNPIP